MRETAYIIQPSFATGEVSTEVANRVDLDKYASALLQAKNAYIRPYGTVYKRGGSIYCGEAKYPDKKVFLHNFTTKGKEFLLEIGHLYIRIWDGDTYTGIELATPYTEDDLSELRFCQSADVMYIASGNYPVYTLNHYSDTDWRVARFEFSPPYFDSVLTTVVEDGSDETIITPSATTGTITLTASKSFFTQSKVKGWLKLTHEISSTTLHLEGQGTTNAVIIGGSWKIITHGTWTGKVTIQKKIGNNGTWKSFREYSSSDDNNISESGTVDEEDVWMRVISTGSDCKVDLTAIGYTKEGWVQITSVSSATQATGEVKKTLGAATKADTYAWGSWDEEYGYPQTVCFFQDRLCFAATRKQPFMLWMSRSGDYPNFSVEKVSGTVTDDSAIALSVVTRNQSSVKHLLAVKDMMVLTDGNELTISGSDTVTPSKATVQLQTSRGASGVFPIMVGNRVIFVQRRGETVRDMGYSLESDSYNGMDLTLLAKHLMRGKTITTSAYMQEPDSRIYFVISDGTINCLAYMQDQKVYAWSHLITDGEYIAACNIEQTNEDSIYVAVKRTVNKEDKVYIERMCNQGESEDPMNYTFLDSAKVLTFDEDSDTGSVPHLIGKSISVLSEGREYKNITVDSKGSFTIPNGSTRMIAGIPYEMKLEVPNVETNTQQGTLQGRRKKMAAVTLRLVNSLGGYVGNNDKQMDQIKYDEIQEQAITLYTGDKEITLPNNPGFGLRGRVMITSSQAYPFNLVALIKELVISE